MLNRNESEDEGVEECVVFRGKVVEKWREATVEKVKASIAITIGREM